jgi:hypothetical protein
MRKLANVLLLGSIVGLTACAVHPTRTVFVHTHGVYHAPPPVVWVPPPPVYVVPRPIFIHPRPVYVHPRPHFYAPRRHFYHYR